MRKKILLLVLVCICAISTVTTNLKEKNLLSDLEFINIEALAFNESDDWYSGYKTGKTPINGKQVDCCVSSATTDACNYGVVGCIKII